MPSWTGQFSLSATLPFEEYLIVPSRPRSFLSRFATMTQKGRQISDCAKRDEYGRDLAISHDYVCASWRCPFADA